MTTYFSDREGGAVPRTQETIDAQTWAGLLSVIEARITDGSLGFGFPLPCPDGGAIYGTDTSSLWRRALAEIPRLRPGSEESPDDLAAYWHPSDSVVPPTDAVLDLLELIARNVGKPNPIWFHEFFHHHHLQHDGDAGRAAWIEDVNRLLARNGLAFEMAADGTIRRLLPGPMRELLAQTEFATGDSETDQLLARAVALISSRDPHAPQDALEKLWDAFERVKTLLPGKKTQSAQALLTQAAAASGPCFNKAVEDEFHALTILGNTLRIRHSETDREPIASRHAAEYLFHRMFALLRYVLMQTGRVRQG